MSNIWRRKEQPAREISTGLGRRQLLNLGTLVTAFTGVSAASALGVNAAAAAPGDKTQPGTYVPVTEKGAASGVATLDTVSKIPLDQLPDLSATYTRLTGIPINVTSAPYNAVGDGMADDMAAFAAAFTAARSSKRSVYIPAKMFYISGELNVSGLTIYGDLAGYYNRDGSVIKGSGAGIVFNQQGTTLRDITTNISALRFENVQTAIRLTYSIYSRISDVAVIDATGPALILGVNTIIGPIWNHIERCQFSAVGAPAVLMGGKDWHNNTIFDDCDFKGAPAVQIKSTGGYGAMNNIFNGCEFRGPTVGLELAYLNVGTKVNSAYMETAGPSIWIGASSQDLELIGNVHGTLRNDNSTGKYSFVHHEAGAATVRVLGGWLTSGAGAEQSNLTYIGSSAPANLKLELIAEPHIAVAAKGFKLMDETVISTAARVNRGNVSVQKHIAPTFTVQYPDGSRPFAIKRNGTQGGPDYGVQLQNNGVTVAIIDNLNRMNFQTDIGTNMSTPATKPGAVIRKLAIRDNYGTILGYLPIYDTIT